MKKIMCLGAGMLCAFPSFAMDNSSTEQVSIVCVENAWEKQLEDVKSICKEAGKKILQIRDFEDLCLQEIHLSNGKKMHQTRADLEAGNYLIQELASNYPTYGILSQDQMNKDPDWNKKEYVWIINPIDGTKEFEKGSDDFHIQIGLLHGDEAVLGVSYYPVTDTYVWAVRGHGAWLEKEGVKERLIAAHSSQRVIIKSSSHRKIEPRLIEWGWDPVSIMEGNLSSTGRLLAMIQGKASFYVSLGASPDGTEKKGGVWNYGANVVIAREAGLILTTLDDCPLDLREPQGLLIKGIVLTNDPLIHEKIVQSDWNLQ
ncbi:MAG: 3'(2'),5'-bisphosphate nucleotidase CysQ [Parachlamydiales bacterium]